MDLFLLFKFSVPVRSKSSEKRGQIYFSMRRYILMEVLCLKILAKVNYRVRFLEI